jgi:ParB-like chromosome segregation protein Spo0J
MSDLKPHPACAAFPMMSPAELDELASDIEENGLVEPIVIHQGQILDGRNRLAACELAHVEPEFREYEGLEGELVAWVLSKNVHRRHLSPSQRAAVAAELATLTRGPNRKTDNTGQLAGVPTQAEAAAQLQIGERSVRRAVAVRDADPVLHEQVKSGAVTVASAERTIRERAREAAAPDLDPQYLEDRAREAAAVAAELALEDARTVSDTDVEFDLPTCRICGCTDDDCVTCSVAQGEPCFWVEDPEGQHLCSRCAAELNARDLVEKLAEVEGLPGAPVATERVRRLVASPEGETWDLAVQAATRLGLLRVDGQALVRLGVNDDHEPDDADAGPEPAQAAPAAAPELVVTRDQIYREERDRRRAEAQARKETRNRELTATASAAAVEVSGLDLRLCDVADLLADPGLTNSAELIHADPPWSYDRADRNGAADGHYDLLSMADIARHLDAAYDLALPDARLLLWVTDPLLAEWFAASSAMRWRFVSAGGWVKTGRPGIGAHWRGDHEPLLMYVKGTPRRPERLLSNGHAGPRTEHSEKPEGWLSELVGGLTGPGALVVDLYAGRAPLLRACGSADRRYVGAEIDPDRRALALAAAARLP